MSTTILETATAVAHELGEDWTVTPHYDYAAKMTNGAVELFARVETYGANRGRVAYSTAYPSGWTDVTRYAEDEHRVVTTAAPDRDPVAVARQIKRTVLPTVEKWTPIFRERMAARADAETARRAVVEQIRKLEPSAYETATGEPATGVRMSPGNAPWYGDVSIRHDGTSGDIELRGLDMADIFSILGVITRKPE